MRQDKVTGEVREGERKTEKGEDRRQTERARKTGERREDSRQTDRRREDRRQTEMAKKTGDKQTGRESQREERGNL